MEQWTSHALRTHLQLPVLLYPLLQLALVLGHQLRLWWLLALHLLHLLLAHDELLVEQLHALLVLLQLGVHVA